MTHIHFIGIGGSGLSAIARLLLEQGHTVSGSDRVLSPFAEDVQAAGAQVTIGHAAENISGAEIIVRSSAIPDENPEIRAAHQQGKPVYKRSDFLGQLMDGKTGIAIAGTHGKTTTTAMMAWTLTKTGLDPSYIIGGVSTDLGNNAHAGTGDVFVIEADEYDRMFLGLKPRIEIVTNLEHDHPDCFPTLAEMTHAFESFVTLLPEDGYLIVCGDDSGAARLLARANQQQTVAYALESEKTFTSRYWVTAHALKPNQRGGFDFSVQSNLAGLGNAPIQVSLQVPGKHNVLNALAVLSVVGLLAVDVEAAAQALAQFTGTGRRFQVLGEANGITIVDDYAHHPTEIRATLAAARARYPQQRIWAVWQPHTYSRTQMLFDAFTKSFNDADQVLVSEIYAAREPRQDFSAKQVVDVMPHASALFIAELTDIRDHLLKQLRSGDVVIVLSAGDADQVSAQVLHALRRK